MGLFDNIERNYLGPKTHSESEYDYLNRSGRCRSAKVRHLLQTWFDYYPEAGKEDIKGRLQSDDDRQHSGAFFELYLYVLLTKHGYCAKIHPEVEANAGGYPDFLVLETREKIPLLYLEATTATLSDEEYAAERRKNVVYDAIDRLESPYFFVGLHVYGAPPSSDPPGRKLRDFLREQLTNLDPDSLLPSYQQQGLGAMPRWQWAFEEWRLEFFPIPKSKQAQGQVGLRPIGAKLEATWLDIDERMRDSLAPKAKKFSHLGLPYVIALNVNMLGSPLGAADLEDISYSLVGCEPWRLPPPRDYPLREGLWYGPKGIQNRHVSAALIANDLTPWTVARTSPGMWHNPWADLPLGANVFRLPQVWPDFENGVIEKAGSAKHARHLLGLPEEWPTD